MAHTFKCLYIIHTLLHSISFLKKFPSVRVAFTVLKESQYVLFFLFYC